MYNIKQFKCHSALFHIHYYVADVHFPRMKTASLHTHTPTHVLSGTPLQALFIPFSHPVSSRKMEDITPLLLNLRDWTTAVAAAWPTSQIPPYSPQKPRFTANCVWATVLHQRRARCALVTACFAPRWVQASLWERIFGLNANIHSSEVVAQSNRSYLKPVLICFRCKIYKIVTNTKATCHLKHINTELLT